MRKYFYNRESDSLFIVDLANDEVESIFELTDPFTVEDEEELEEDEEPEPDEDESLVTQIRREGGTTTVSLETQRKKKKSIVCKKCGQEGHNQRTCSRHVNEANPIIAQMAERLKEGATDEEVYAEFTISVTDSQFREYLEKAKTIANV